MSGACCSITGRNREESFQRHAEWLGGWGLTFLKELQTAIAAIDAMRATDSGEIRAIIANGYKKNLLDRGILHDSSDPDRPLRKQYEDAVQAVEKDHLPIDSWTNDVVTDPTQFNKWRRHLELTFIGRPVKALSNDNDKTGYSEVEYISSTMTWWPNYMNYLDGRYNNNTIWNHLSDTVYLPEGLVTKFAELFKTSEEELAELKKNPNIPAIKLWNSLHEFADKNNVEITIYYNAKGDWVLIKPAEETTKETKLAESLSESLPHMG